MKTDAKSLAMFFGIFAAGYVFFTDIFLYNGYGSPSKGNSTTLVGGFPNLNYYINWNYWYNLVLQKYLGGTWRLQTYLGGPIISFVWLENAIAFFITLNLEIGNALIYFFSAVTYVLNSIFIPFQYIPQPLNYLFETFAFIAIGIAFVFAIRIVSSGLQGRQ